MIQDHVTFMNLRISVAPGVLVPRAETELLATVALRRLQAWKAAGTKATTVIDMCCGAGNLACAIATNIPDATVFACDLTTECVGLARRNVAELDLGSRVHVLQGDLFTPLAERGLLGSVDMIVCNPPYLSSRRLETQSAVLLDHEPREAFDAGPYGLTFHQRLVAEATPFLRVGGVLVMEFGVGQVQQVKTLVGRSRAYGGLAFESDREGQLRVLETQKL